MCTEDAGVVTTPCFEIVMSWINSLICFQSSFAYSLASLPGVCLGRLAEQ